MPEQAPNGQNGSHANGAGMVDLEAVLAEISARLNVVSAADGASAHERETAPIERMQAMVFALGESKHAVELGYVGEIVRSPEITPVPGLPAWVLGVTNLHGEIVSVVDLARFLDMAVAGRPAQVMLVAKAGDQCIGLVVNQVETIYTFPVDQVVSPPFRIEPGLVAYLRGAVERDQEFIRLLDCERLLLGSQMQQFH